MDTEKITLNLSPVELGKIDLLVEHGLFSNRSDFIRAALRQYLNGYEDDIRTYLKSPFLGTGGEETPRIRDFSYIGVCHVAYGDLISLKNAGEKCRISAVGILHMDKRITPALFTETVESVKVYGSCAAADDIKAMIAQNPA